MFDDTQNHGITIDFYISLCYYMSTSKYVVTLMIYKDFLVCIKLAQAIFL